MVYGSTAPAYTNLLLYLLYEPSILPYKIINVNNVHCINMLKDKPCKYSIHPLCSLLTDEACFLLTIVEFSSQVKHEDSDLFAKNGTSAVIREGNILKMQRKQKPCIPIPSNKQSRYYRPRVKVSTRTNS